MYALLKAFPPLKPLWRDKYTDIHERIHSRAGLSTEGRKGVVDVGDIVAW